MPIRLRQTACKCSPPDSTRLFSTPFAIEDVLGMLVRHYFANRSQYPDISTRWRQLEDALLARAKGRFEDPEVGARLTRDRLAGAAVRLFTPSDMPPAILTEAKRIGLHIGRAAVRQAQLQAEFPEHFPVPAETQFEEPSVYYRLRVYLHRIACVRETPPEMIFSDDLCCTGEWEYADSAEKIGPLQREFDTGDSFPAPGEQSWILADVQLKPNASTSFRCSLRATEDDLVDPALADLINDVVTFLGKAAVTAGKAALLSMINSEIDSSSLPPEAKRELKEEVEDAVDKAGDQAREKVKRELEDWIAAAIGPEILMPFPIGLRVNIDWLIPGFSPTWQCHLQRTPQGDLQLDEGTVTSEWLAVQQEEADAGFYRFQFQYRVSRIHYI